MYGSRSCVVSPSFFADVGLRDVAIENDGRRRPQPVLLSRMISRSGAVGGPVPEQRRVGVSLNRDRDRAAGSSHRNRRDGRAGRRHRHAPRCFLNRADRPWSGLSSRASTARDSCDSRWTHRFIRRAISRKASTVSPTSLTFDELRCRRHADELEIVDPELFEPDLAVGAPLDALVHGAGAAFDLRHRQPWGVVDLDLVVAEIGPSLADHLIQRFVDLAGQDRGIVKILLRRRGVVEAAGALGQMRGCARADLVGGDFQREQPDADVALAGASRRGDLERGFPCRGARPTRSAVAGARRQTACRRGL